MKKKFGYSLIEVIVATVLIAIIFVPVATLFPVAIIASKNTENRQTAVYLGKACLEEVKGLSLPSLPNGFKFGRALTNNNAWVEREPPFPKCFLFKRRKINKTTFTITRRIWVVEGQEDSPPSLVDATVIVTYPRQTAPIVLSSRFYMGQ